LKVAYPWFGGKSRIASTVWEYFGDVTNYVEPFFGGGYGNKGKGQGRKNCHKERVWFSTLCERNSALI
jgi:hypothetical protein